MWEKNRESVRLVKRITTLLLEVWRDKDFAIEILNALEKHTDACEDFIAFLEKGTQLVPSEIYERVSEITGGTFVKELSKVCIAKTRCIEDPSDENWRLLFDALASSKLIFVCEWNLTEDEKAAFENSNVGDTLHIETEIRPIILEGTTGRKLVIPVYSSEYEIGRMYRGEEYAIQNSSWNYALAAYDACVKVWGDATIILDIDSDKCLEINRDLIEHYRNNSSF